MAANTTRTRTRQSAGLPPCTSYSDSRHQSSPDQVPGGGPEHFLSRIVNFATTDWEETANAERGREVERIRNLFIFSLSTDYQCNNNISLSTADREHFKAMSFHIADASQDIGLLAAESWRWQLTPYFRKYLHEPCQALKIPPEIVLLCLDRMTKYFSHNVDYTGCCFHILQHQGLSVLAGKLYADQYIIIPRVIENLRTRNRIHKSLCKLRALYFERLQGVESSVELASKSDSWAELQKVTYEASKRGETYERLRTKNHKTARVYFSLRRWADRARRGIQEKLRR